MQPGVSVHGHALELIKGAREYFPALIRDIDLARHEVRLETYIFDFTATTSEVAQALLRATRRGVKVSILVDGFGTGTLPRQWQQEFAKAGVEWQVYAPVGRFGLLSPRGWRRLHRKLCLIDGHIAYCGGINLLDDFHDPHHGALKHPRWDFCVRVTGPLVHDAYHAVHQLWWRVKAVRDVGQREFNAAWQALQSSRALGAETSYLKAQGEAGHRVRARLLLRDNLTNRTRIERAYRKAIGEARSEVIIANAYFLPGRKMRNALVRAARRGVRVVLLLQGRYEYFLQYHAARPVYGMLLAAGVEIHEYAASFLHAKVAVIDGHWATVGSSNLDPISVLLAREANVVIEDARFARQLREEILQATQRDGVRVDPMRYASRPWPQRALDWVAYGMVRLALALTGWRY